MFNNKISKMKYSGNKHFISALVIAVCVFMSKATGVLRDIFFAKYLGSSIIGEAFYIAFRLPNTFRRMFADGAFSNVFVPFFSTKIKENKNDALIFANRVLFLLVCFLFLITILIEIFMPELIGLINPGFIRDKNRFDMAIVLSRIAFPYIIFISISALFGSMLNGIGSFWQFASISIILNAVLIFGLCFTNNLFSNTGFCLVWMIIFAGILQVVILFISCIRKQLITFGKKIDSIKNGRQKNNDVKIFLKKLIPAIFSSGILQINIFVDCIFASFFAGAISHLYYTDRIGQFPLSLIGYSLSIAILPALSIAFKEKDNAKIASIQTDSVDIAMFFSIPLTLLIITLATPIIQLIYERGMFTASDTIIVSNMIRIYAITIPFNILSKIFFVSFYARKDTSTPLKISIFSLIFNIISNLILIHIVGRYCVIISTTLSSILSTIITIIFLKKNNDLMLKIKDCKKTTIILLISSFSCCVLPSILYYTFNLHLFTSLCICCIFHLCLMFFTGILSKNLISRLLG
ncbi:MAG: murein biosynthesis integral membrane protein MurJ [Rickettsiales bacterium]|nr:murein biosynthesis integral membrane protein MurJ [Rickettsiales bacterium]